MTAISAQVLLSDAKCPPPPPQELLQQSGIPTALPPISVPASLLQGTREADLSLQDKERPVTRARSGALAGSGGSGSRRREADEEHGSGTSLGCRRAASMPAFVGRSLIPAPAPAGGGEESGASLTEDDS